MRDELFNVKIEWLSTVSGWIYYPFFTPTANTESWAAEAFSLCVFTSTKSPSGPPWNEGHQPKVRHETSVLEVPVQEQH